MTLPPSITKYIAERLNNDSPKRLEGWCSAEKTSEIANLVFSERPKVVVEVGVFAGRSLFSFALALKELGNGGRVIGIDPWSAHASVQGWENDPDNYSWWSRLDHSSIYGQCVQTIKELELDNVTLFKGTSQQAFTAMRFAFPVPFVGIAHVDGNHNQESALFDVKNCLETVQPGGVIIMDDIDWETTKPAVSLLESRCKKLKTVGNCGFFRVP